MADSPSTGIQDILPGKSTTMSFLILRQIDRLNYRIATMKTEEELRPTLLSTFFSLCALDGMISSFSKQDYKDKTKEYRKRFTEDQMDYTALLDWYTILLLQLSQINLLPQKVRSWDFEDEELDNGSANPEEDSA